MIDHGTLGAISTVLVTIAFIAVCWWAFSPRRKSRFEEDANLPFADEFEDKPKDEPHSLDKDDDDAAAGRK